ncbi:helix-turn-helix domain-containing protein [Halosimplex rubrum]|uniref:Helix-turn-helix domain-containing protein n=1 Tax=Halosimplex rubrum TaxID=869889 RepID=A0A7D5PAK5_9EURY|nr:helix-turn-helix domain-containing protein [Halosimplex rubrum]QLH78360.1 helix-turn-helix domain-containing protein [Halosimplex rubrum]
MAITTEFVLSSPALPLVSITERLQPNEIECVHALCLQSDVRMFIVQIDPDDDVAEAELAALDEIDETTVLGETSEKAVYKLVVDVDESISAAFDPERFDGAPIKPTTITPEGWHERKVFTDFEAFTEFRTSCENHGISFDLLSMTPDPSQSENLSQDELTDRQREALTIAVSRGYYEDPRQVTAEELAEELGISQPSLSSLLRRGERQLISSSLGSQVQLNTITR